jgi:alpha-L-rhamnosidase
MTLATRLSTHPGTLTSTRTRLQCLTVLLGILLSGGFTPAQTPIAPLDPARGAAFNDAANPQILPEEYIWTANDITAQRPDRSKFSWIRADLRVEPHLFRTHFHLDQLPHSGTLYLAGPRWARVYLNGTPLGEFSTNTDQPINFRVFHVDATAALHAGDNVLAIEAVRGRGVVSGAGPITTQQLAYGEVLTAKLLAGPFGDDHARSLVITDRNWKSKTGPAPDHWQESGFDDSTWQQVTSLGPIESNIDFMQWSADAGMYGWPGYRGMSSWLRPLTLTAVQVTHVYEGAGAFVNVEALTGPTPAAPFAVSLHQPAPTDAEAPSLLLDFGRELAGRILIESNSAQDTVVSIAYGESELEALATGITPTQRGGNYLGTNLLDIPAHGVARGPKSAFRYVRIRFLRGAPQISLSSIRAEAIVYPVHYEGSFESSDPLLNRIWETAAYTAHLCMQDGIWDAPKRDRGRWAGDLDVEGRVILTAFGDKFLLEDTLRRLAEGTPPGQPVNGIAGYTAQWITTLASLYEHSGDRAFVASQHNALLRFLHTMDDDLDPATGLLKPAARGWGFVDWAPGLYGSTPEARIGTTLEFLRAYAAAPALLRAAGDESAAQQYEAQATHLREAARAAYISPATHSVGSTWQLNSLAVLTGLDPQQNPAIWNNVLVHVKQDAPTDQVISPYFNAYLLEAMARTGHEREALDWMRTYWGGMLAEGATSFWESYDLRWPKTNFHLSLEADGTSGYFVSLAHGWSSGPLAWLSENVLGIRPTAPGYDAVDVRPNLLGLQFAHGSVATPHGPISISIDATKGISLDLPKGIESARLFLPSTTEGKENAPIVLTHSGHYEFALH